MNVIEKWKLIGNGHIKVSYFMDQCKVMTNKTIAANTSQPERPNERFSTFSMGNDEYNYIKLGTELPCARMISPNARRPNDRMINTSCILLRLVNWTVFSMIGGSVRGRYNEIAIPINSIAIVCIARQYKAKRYVSSSSPYGILNKAAIKMPRRSRINDILLT